MAKSVVVLQFGAQPKTLDDVRTVQDVLDELGLDEREVTVKVNGAAASGSTSLGDYNQIAIGEKVKGGC